MADRSIPSIGSLLDQYREYDLPHRVLAGILRSQVARLRRGDIQFSGLHTVIEEALRQSIRSKIQPVINATGVVVHTNLGRSPIGVSSGSKATDIASGYSNLELDLTTGKRGSRGSYVESGLATLCGAEAATAVNNCAAALVLVLQSLTRKKREVIISRGELVQIGGGFRIPEILESAGAVLKEVGTTNKTTPADYEAAITSETALILKVHRSNFEMKGFVQEVDLKELASLAKKRRCPLVFDLGTGNVGDTYANQILVDEITPERAVKQGVHLICFSGDKLMGGPQAGVIAGKARLIASLKKNPLFRAMRCDKLILTSLQSVVDAYLDLSSGESPGYDQVPIHGLIEMSEEETKCRCESWIRELGSVSLDVGLAKTKDTVGGGSLPGSSMLSYALAVRHPKLKPDACITFLRDAMTPIIAGIQEDRVMIHSRTVLSGEDSQIISRLKELDLLG